MTEENELDGFAPDLTDNTSADDLALATKMAKLKKKIPDTLVDELEAMSVDDLKARIVRCEVNLHETEQAKTKDAELELAKAKVRELQEPYTDAKKLQSAIIAYCTCLLDQKGAA